MFHVNQVCVELGCVSVIGLGSHYALPLWIKEVDLMIVKSLFQRIGTEGIQVCCFICRDG